MGRALPYECHHGTTVDWGDFGPHQNGCEDECFGPDGRCPDQPGCDLCDQEEQRTDADYEQVKAENERLRALLVEVDVAGFVPPRDPLTGRIEAALTASKGQHRG